MDEQIYYSCVSLSLPVPTHCLQEGDWPGNYSVNTGRVQGNSICKLVLSYAGILLYHPPPFCCPNIASESSLTLTSQAFSYWECGITFPVFWQVEKIRRELTQPSNEMTVATRPTAVLVKDLQMWRVEPSVLGVCFGGLVCATPWSIVSKS